MYKSLRVVGVLAGILVFGLAAAKLSTGGYGQRVTDREAAALVGGDCGDYDTFTCFSGPKSCPDTTCYDSGTTVLNKSYTKTYPCGGNKECGKVYSCLQPCKGSGIIVTTPGTPVP